MEIFVSGVLAGIALAIPLGPMAILLISTTIKHGRKIGVFGALAMASVDFSYAAIVFAFGNVVIGFLTDWVFPLRVLGSLILLYVGVKIFVDARRSSKINSPDLTNSPTSKLKTYAKFFGLTVLNLTKSITNAKVQHRIQYAGALLIVALAIGLILK